MSTTPEFETQRDLEATQIPSGQKSAVVKGTKGRIVQALGGSYTVLTQDGYMLRIEGVDGDAIGQQKIEGPTLDGLTVEEKIWAQLRTCYDPEIPVNIADLGLIYACEISDFPDGGHRVEIKMTLTAPGCGMGDVLKAEVQRKLLTLPEIKDVQVALVWEPTWNRDLMSDAAKLKLGMY
jgi:probable FeS assembly SUF system protein SufT